MDRGAAQHKSSRLLVLAVVCICIGACSAASSKAAAKAEFFESFGPGWTARWHYAAAKKYQGRFTVVKPPGFQDTAIQVRATSCKQQQHQGGQTAGLWPPATAAAAAEAGPSTQPQTMCCG